MRSGLRSKRLAEEVVGGHGPASREYAANPSEVEPLAEATLEALAAVAEYRLYTDLERGWRITMPNLEQTGLLSVEYAGLAEIAGDEESWKGAADPLRTAAPDVREDLAKVLMDELRRERAMDDPYFTEARFAELRKESAKLNEAWAVSDTEVAPPPPRSPSPAPGALGAPAGCAAS